MASLNNLDVIACDVRSASLKAPYCKKVWFITGPKFGSQKVSAVKIERAVNALKSSEALWRVDLNTTITDMGFHSTTADPNVCGQSYAKPNGFKYNEYVLNYVDDVLNVLDSPQDHLS